MRKILTYFSFVIASLIVIAAFMTSTTYTQLAIAILLYPLLVYFAFRAFPRGTRSCLFNKPVTEIQSTMQSAEIGGSAKSENTIGIADIDKRVFLKLIGGIGLSLFLFSLFNKKAEGLFFKSLPAQGATVSIENIAGKKIDPAQSQPTDGYSISEIDNNITFTFYGFTNKDGGWFVMQEDEDTGSFRYTKGDSNFPGSWDNRENLKYDYYSNVF